MLNFENTIVGVLRDKNTGEVTRTFEGRNHVQDRFLKSIIENEGRSIRQTMFVSGFNPGKQRRDYVSIVYDGSVLGSNISGVPASTFTPYATSDTHLLQIIQRFDAPAQDFTINLVGLCENVVGSGPTQYVLNVDAAVWLSTPCIQTTSEILDIYYRVQIRFNPNWKTEVNSGFELTGFEALHAANNIAAVSGYTSYLVREANNCLYTPLNKIDFRKLDSYSNFGHMSFTTGSIVKTQNLDRFFYRVKNNSAASNNIGHMVGGLMQSTRVLPFKAVDADNSPLQSIFGHRDTSVTPFYSPSTAQLGLGDLAVDVSNWDDPDFGKYYKIDVNTSGINGVGDYKFRVRDCFGFNGNTFQNFPCQLIWTTQRNAHYTDNVQLCHDNIEDGSVSYDNARKIAYPVKYKDGKVIFVNADNFVVTNLVTSASTGITNTTIIGADIAPRFLATKISQVTPLANGSIAIACKDTGLYIINEALDTLTVINSSTPGLTNVSGCCGVCEGYGGRLWAFFEHTTQPTLYYSDDSGANWTATTFTDTLLDVNPEHVVAVQADKNHVNHRVAVVHLQTAQHVTTDSEIRVKWWLGSTSTKSDGPTVTQMDNSFVVNRYYIPVGQHHGYQEIVNCSPNDGVWACVMSSADSVSDLKPSKLEFGTANQTVMTGGNALETKDIITNWTQNSSGNDVLVFMSTSSNGPSNTGRTIYNSFSTLVMLETDMTTLEYEECSHLNLSAFCTHLLPYKDGVWLSAYVDGNTVNYGDYNFFYLTSCVPHDGVLTRSPEICQWSYPEYGWNGSAWVKGNAGAKSFHAASELLHDGINISFDDGSGTNQFLDSDHYTFGVYDGIWCDGATTFDFEWKVYVKPSQHLTDLEASTLPGTTKVPNVMEVTQPDSDAAYTDLASTTTGNTAGDLTATGTATVGIYNGGARSVNPAIRGDITSFLPNNTYVPGTDITNAQGWIDVRVFQSITAETQMYIGLSPASVLGTALDATTIKYAVHIDSDTDGDNSTAQIRVIEENQVRVTLTDIPLKSGGDNIRIMMVLLTNGSMSYLYKISGGVWTTMYTSTPGSVTIENLHLDFNYVPRINNGLEDVTFYSLDSANSDYYLYLGNGVDSGIFNPNFLAIDSENINIIIDGTEAINVGENDNVNTLAANSYSIFPEAGVIRYSASDVGKSVTGDYVTITHE